MWTAESRDNWIYDCTNSKKKDGWFHSSIGRFDWKIRSKAVVSETIVLNSQNCSELEFVDREEIESKVTELLAKLILNDKYRCIPKKFYEILMGNVYENLYTSKNIKMWINGKTMNRGVEFVIYINPKLQRKHWERIKDKVHTIVLQTMSIHKQLLDCVFRPDKMTNNQLMSSDQIKSFKQDYKDELLKIKQQKNRQILSPFGEIAIKNKSSRNSCLITESEVWPDHNVLIDIPHFPDAIPLTRTPLYIVYDSVNSEETGFESCKLRINNYRAYDDDPEKWMTIAGDLITVKIPDQMNVALANFWEKGKYGNTWDSDWWLQAPED